MGFIETLKKDPGCLYIYNWGPYIYGLSNEPTEYIVIVSDLGKSPSDLNFPDIWGINMIKVDNICYGFYRMKYGFDKILLGDIDCGECACLNKKFIIKEHVKLTMQVNLLQLRKEIDLDLNITIPTLASEETITGSYGRVICCCKFANQIIDNHKIINFKEANRDYELLKNASDKEYVYKTLIKVPYSNLRLKTDSLLRKNKIQRFLQKKHE